MAIVNTSLPNPPLDCTNVLNMIDLHRTGFLNKSYFQSKIIKMRFEQFPKITQPVYFNKDMKYCKFLKSTQDGVLIMVDDGTSTYQTRTLVNPSAIHTLHFKCLPSDFPVFHSRGVYQSALEIKYSNLEKIIVTDTCDVLHGMDKFLFYVGNSPKKGGVAIWSSSNINERKDCEWRFPDRIKCCTSIGTYPYKFAIGCENGFYVLDFMTVSKHSKISTALYSITFNNDGNVLFLGTATKGIVLYDLREKTYQPRIRVKTQNVMGTILNGDQVLAREMKSLSDGVSLVIADDFGRLHKIDTRMRRTVFQYPGHHGCELRRTLSLNEDLDLIASVGNDSFARIWQLSSGKQLWTNALADPQDFKQKTPSHPPHCAFVTDQRQWYVYILQNNRVVSLHCV